MMRKNRRFVDIKKRAEEVKNIKQYKILFARHKAKKFHSINMSLENTTFNLTSFVIKAVRKVGLVGAVEDRMAAPLLLLPPLPLPTLLLVGRFLVA